LTYTFLESFSLFFPEPFLWLFRSLHRFHNKTLRDYWD
jgi:hypothetical protein